MMAKRSWRLVGPVLAGALLAGACGGGSDQAGSGSKQGAGSLSGKEQLAGDIRIDGSSTVLPLSEAAGELFAEEQPGVRVTVGSSGTGGGFEKFCNGEIDIADASRPMKPEEKVRCDAKGIGFQEFQVANDGIAVVVNPENDWADCLTVAQLKKIWDAGSQVDGWRDVDSKLPNERLELFGPGTDSGTFDYFTEAVNGKAKQSRDDYSPSENDNVIVQGVAGTRGALGYFGLSYAKENQDKLNTIKVDGGAGCVGPSVETVQDGSYKPLSRPLFLYPSAELLGRPEGLAFLEFYFSHTEQIAEQALFVPLTGEQVTKLQSQLADLLAKAKVG